MSPPWEYYNQASTGFTKVKEDQAALETSGNSRPESEPVCCMRELVACEFLGDEACLSIMVIIFSGTMCDNHWRTRCFRSFHFKAFSSLFCSSTKACQSRNAMKTLMLTPQLEMECNMVLTYHLYTIAAIAKTQECGHLSCWPYEVSCVIVAPHS